MQLLDPLIMNEFLWRKNPFSKKEIFKCTHFYMSSAHMRIEANNT